MSQPLSRVQSNQRIAVSALYVLNYPEFATQAMRVIAHWAHIDGNMAVILSRMLKSDITAGSAMYMALMGGEAKRAALLAVARHSLTESDLVLLQACLKATKASRNERNDFAHNVWGVCESVPNALLLMPYSVVVDVNISYRQRLETPPGGGGIIAPKDYDANKIMVYRAGDFKRAVEAASAADQTLFGTYHLALASAGVFVLRLGWGNLYVDKGAGNHFRNEKVPFRGTFVVCQIDCDRPDLIEKALVIGGKTHTPPFDFIERKHETDLDSIRIKANEISRTFGSRQSGIEARRYIKNVLGKDIDAIVELDFDNVNVISSSYADEVFGKMFVELGPLRYMRCIRLLNVKGN